MKPGKPASPVPPDPLNQNSQRSTGRRLNGAIVTKLGIAIVAGEYAPGETLSGEVAFSEALDVSRNAYREAMQVLTAKGMVESRPKTGTKVLPRDRWNLLDPDVLAWSFAGMPERNFVRGLFELRGIIEPAAAGFAAERRDTADLDRMASSLAAMRHHTLARDEGQSADRDFHDAILHATRNDALVVLSAGIGAAVRYTTQFKQRAGSVPRDPLPDHVAVYDAIVARKPARARKAMAVLVDLALQDLSLAMAE